MLLYQLTAPLWAEEPVQNPPAFAMEGAQTNQSAGPSTTFVLLKKPEDLDALLERLSRPDFVVLDFARYKELQGSIDQGNLIRKEPEVSIRTLRITGELQNEAADLQLLLQVRKTSGASSILPIRLDDAWIQDARAGNQNLLVTKLTGVGWGVSLPDQGEYEVSIRFRTRISIRGAGRRLQLAIPETASSSIDLRIMEPAEELKLGSRQIPLDRDTGHNTGWSSLKTSISPRSVLDLTWTSSKIPIQPKFSVVSEVSVIVDNGILRWDSRHDIESDRDVISRLNLDLDPSLSKYQVLADGLPCIFEVQKEYRCRIDLENPIRPGDLRTIQIKAERPLREDEKEKISIQGLLFQHATSETGWLTVGSGPQVHLKCGSNRSISRLLTRSGIPPRLLGVTPYPEFLFSIQGSPFNLQLETEPTKPWIFVNCKNVLNITQTNISTELKLNYQTQNPPPREISLGIPSGWVLDSIGPDSIIQSTSLASPVPPDSKVNRLIIRLKEQPVEPSKFTISCAFRWSGPRTGKLDLPWIQPLDASSWIGTSTVRATAGLQVTPYPDDSLTILAVPIDERSLNSSPSLSNDMQPCFTVQHTNVPPTLKLEVLPLPLRLRVQSESELFVDRLWTTKFDQVVIRIDQGQLRTLELEVPTELYDHWELEGLDISHRETLASSGSIGLTKLHLLKPLSDQVRLRIRSRLATPNSQGQEAALLKFPPIVIHGATYDSVTTELGSANGLEIHPTGTGLVSSDRPRNIRAEKEFPYKRIETGSTPSPQNLKIQAVTLAQTPEVILSRLMLSTTKLGDGSIGIDIHGIVETHHGKIPLSLPHGATIKDVMIGQSPAEIVQNDALTGNYILGLPRTEGRIEQHLHLAYSVLPSSEISSSWLPGFPTTVEIRETYWEIDLPSRECLLGVPPGWNSCNRWSWFRYSFGRKPTLNHAELLKWLQKGRADQESQLIPKSIGSQVGSANRMLFHRSGHLITTEPTVVSLVSLVTASSTFFFVVTMVFMYLGIHLLVLLSFLFSLFVFLVFFVNYDIGVQISQSGIPGMLLGYLTSVVTRQKEQKVLRLPDTLTKSGVPGTTVVRPPMQKDENYLVATAENDDDRTRIRPRSQEPPPSTTVYRMAITESHQAIQTGSLGESDELPASGDSGA